MVSQWLAGQFIDWFADCGRDGNLYVSMSSSAVACAIERFDGQTGAFLNTFATFQSDRGQLHSKNLARIVAFRRNRMGSFPRAYEGFTPLTKRAARS